MAAPCPVCGEPNGFHDHGRPDSRHDAHIVPRHLALSTASERKREARNGGG